MENQPFFVNTINRKSSTASSTASSDSSDFASNFNGTGSTAAAINYYKEFQAKQEFEENVTRIIQIGLKFAEQLL
jgi:hypothetical protein